MLLDLFSLTFGGAIGTVVGIMGGYILTREEIRRIVRILWERYIPMTEVDEQKEGKGEKD